MAQPEQTDVLVIGGGAAGLCCAYFLAKKGLKVILVERGGLGEGSSFANAGWVAVRHAKPLAVPGAITQGLKWLLDPGSPFFVRLRPDLGLLRWLLRFQKMANKKSMQRIAPVLLDLNRRGNELFRQMAGQGLDFGYRQKGLLHIYRTEQGLQKGKDEAVWLGTFGLDSELFGPADVSAFEPSVRPGAAGGIFYPEPAHLEPAALVGVLGEEIARLGADIRLGAEVTGFENVGGRIASVLTRAGDFAPAQVVVAAGAWSAPLGKALGEELLLEPAKGYSFTAEPPIRPPERPLSLDEARVAVTPMEGTFRFSSTFELAGFNPAFNRRRLAATRQAVDRYLVGMEALAIRETWYGYRPATPDSLPIIGPSPRYENLIYATGHGMLGITQAPITGKLVAQMAAGDELSMDIAPFRIGRF